MEIRSLYDKEGNLTDKTYKKGDKIPNDYYTMIVAIAIQNNNGEFLMQKRSLNKGGDWGVTGGHPKASEDCDAGIITEVKEELGIDISLEKLEVFAKGFDGEEHYQFYYLNKDYDIKDFVLQEEELTEVRWFSIEELEHMVEMKELNENQIAFFLKCKSYLEKKSGDK